jgi:MFS family permease
MTNGLILVAGAMLGPIYALFVERIGGDLLDASYTFAAFAVTAGVVTLLSGKYSDKMKESEIIVALGYSIMALGFFSYVFVSSLAMLLIVQVVIGLGEAIYAPSFDALYSKHITRGKSGRQWGAWEAINYFTIAIGAVGGGLLVTQFGFNAMFVAMGLLSVFSALFILFLPRDVL